MRAGNMMENLVCRRGVVATRKSDMVCSFTIEKASFCWGKKKNRKLSERLVWKSARAKQKKRAGEMMENRVCLCGVVATSKSDMVCSFTFEKASFCWGNNKKPKLSARLVWNSAREKKKCAR